MLFTQTTVMEGTFKKTIIEIIKLIKLLTSNWSLRPAQGFKPLKSLYANEWLIVAKDTAQSLKNMTLQRGDKDRVDCKRGQSLISHV